MIVRCLRPTKHITSFLVLLLVVSFGERTLFSDASIGRVGMVQKSREGDLAAIEFLGKSGDVSLISTLLVLIGEARDSKASPVLIRALRKSLAQLGDPTARREICLEISSKDRYEQHHAFADAAIIGGNDMIIAVAEKLFDTSSGGRPTDKSGKLIKDVSLPSPRHAAVVALSSMITDESAPRIDLKKITYSEENVLQWQKWWLANKTKFDASP